MVEPKILDFFAVVGGYLWFREGGFNVTCGIDNDVSVKT